MSATKRDLTARFGPKWPRKVLLVLSFLKNMAA